MSTEDERKTNSPVGILKHSNATNAPKVINYHPNPNPKAIANSRYFGGFSFESESLPEFSEFEDNSETAGATTKRYYWSAIEFELQFDFH